MTTFAEPITKEQRKVIQITSSEDDYAFLKLLADEANITQGQVIHILLQMMAQCVNAAREMGKVDEAFQIPMIEQYTIQILRHLGLLTQEEFARALIAADAMGPDKVQVRLHVLQNLANERLAELRSQWEKQRQAEKTIRQWDADQAAKESLRAAEKSLEVLSN